jgi:hypothetical protein
MLHIGYNTFVIVVKLYQQFLGAHRHVIVEVFEMKNTIDKKKKYGNSNISFKNIIFKKIL